MSAHPSITPAPHRPAPSSAATAREATVGSGPAWRGMALIAVAAVAWGTGGAVAAVLYRTSGLGPIAVSYWRFVIGALTLAVYLALRDARSRRRTASRDSGRLTDARSSGRRAGTRGSGSLTTAHGSGRRAAARGSDRRAAAQGSGTAVRRAVLMLASGVGLAVYQSAFYAAIADAGLAVGTVVTLGAGPILIAVGARVVLAERLGRAGAVAITLALSGLVALSLDSGAAGPDPVRGLVFALLSALGYAVVTLIGRAANPAGDPFRTALAGFLVGGVVLTPFALAEGVLPVTAGLPATIGWLLYLGVVTSALAYGLFFAGLAHVNATTASIVTLLEPVAAALLAIVFLGEHLTAAVLIGMLLLLGAVAGLTRPNRR
ncbi:DMT family transporter [Catenuloplanes sp. NPDC051500]|uniref:DMT family transporter n=1 Tax=Catenuloplanes sp. NPDC051500 TaxID=3363959 RepID=UPI00378F3714